MNRVEQTNLFERCATDLRPMLWRLAGGYAAEAQRENLRALDHQIWLLRNVIWWYLLPLDLGLFGWALGLGWGQPLWLLFYLIGFGLIGGITAVYVYRLNQKAVRTDLMPQREALARELEAWETADRVAT